MMQGNIKPTAVAISLIKGFHLQPEGGISLLTNLIKEHLEIQTAALMGESDEVTRALMVRFQELVAVDVNGLQHQFTGANLANEVAAEHFCESTIGCADLEVGFLLKELFQV